MNFTTYTPTNEEREFHLLVNNLEDQRNIAELRLLAANTVDELMKSYAQAALDYLES